MRLIRHIVCYTTAVAALFAVFVAQSTLFGADLAKDTAKLFEFGTKNTPTAVAAAKSQFEQLKRIDPMDRRIDYAYGVALVNQHRYREALPLLSRYLDSGTPGLN